MTIAPFTVEHMATLNVATTNGRSKGFGRLALAAMACDFGNKGGVDEELQQWEDWTFEPDFACQPSEIEWYLILRRRWEAMDKD